MAVKKVFPTIKDGCSPRQLHELVDGLFDKFIVDRSFVEREAVGYFGEIFHTLKDNGWHDVDIYFVHEILFGVAVDAFIFTLKKNYQKAWDEYLPDGYKEGYPPINI